MPVPLHQQQNLFDERLEAKYYTDSCQLINTTVEKYRKSLTEQREQLKLKIQQNEELQIQDPEIDRRKESMTKERTILEEATLLATELQHMYQASMPASFHSFNLVSKSFEKVESFRLYLKTNKV